MWLWGGVGRCGCSRLLLCWARLVPLLRWGGGARRGCYRCLLWPCLVGWTTLWSIVASFIRTSNFTCVIAGKDTIQDIVPFLLNKDILGNAIK